MSKFTEIQSKWIEIAEELNKRSNSNPNTTILENMLRERKTDFILLSQQSQREKPKKYQFTETTPGTPDKILHDKLFIVASVLGEIINLRKNPKEISKEYLGKYPNLVLLKHLLNSLLDCFSL